MLKPVYLVECLWDDVVVLRHQVGDGLQQLHQVKALLVTPRIIPTLAEIKQLVI